MPILCNNNGQSTVTFYYSVVHPDSTAVSLLITMHFKNGSICVHHTCIAFYIYDIFLNVLKE